MKKCRISSSEWRRRFYDSKTGIPTIKEINASIDQGEIPGNVIAGKYVVYCDPEYEPLWNETPTKPTPPVKVTNPIALKVLAARN